MNKPHEGELFLATLGKTEEQYPLSKIEDHQIHATTMVRQTKRNLCLFSFNLDPQLYATATFCEVVKNLAMRSRFSRIRILLQDHTLVLQQGHQLVNLAQRLSSAMEIRKPAEEHRDIEENFLLADNCGYLHRQQANTFNGMACYNDRPQVNRYQALFDEVWEYGTADRELTRLHL
jgi:hypothetical protein